MGRTAPLTSKRCILCIYSTNIGTEYFKRALYSPLFFSSKCCLFHNANLFGSCIIHILYTGCAKIKKKNNSGAKGLSKFGSDCMNPRCNHSALFPSPFFSRIVHAFCIYQPIYTQSFATFVSIGCMKFPFYRQIAVAITDDASLLKPQIFSCFGSQACSILTFLSRLSRCHSDVPVRIFAAVE